MALYHKWDVKNDFTAVLQFFSLISDGLGGVCDVLGSSPVHAQFLYKKRALRCFLCASFEQFLFIKKKKIIERLPAIGQFIKEVRVAIMRWKELFTSEKGHCIHLLYLKGALHWSFVYLKVKKVTSDHCNTGALELSTY